MSLTYNWLIPILLSISLVCFGFMLGWIVRG